VERVAILTFENLTGDPALDWVGRGLAEIVGGQLASSSRYYVTSLQALHGLDGALGARPEGVPGISAERPAALAVNAARIVYGNYSRHGSGLRVEAAVEDPATRRTSPVLAVEAPDALAAAGTVARALDPAARPFPTRNLTALRDYVAALETGDEAAAARATTQDPGFGPAWITLAQLALRSRGPAAAGQVLEQAAARGLAAQEGAQVEYSLALLRADPAAARRALGRLSQAIPADPGPYRALSDMAVQEHKYNDAIAYLRTATVLHPGDHTLWNAIGYGHAYAGDLSAATAALERYRELRPRDPNPYDSLGDVHFYLGRFQDAERYYRTAWERDRRFLEGGPLYKAAWSRLMRGDVAGATRVFERYMEARAEDPLAAWRRAEWSWLTGHRREAVAALAKAVPEAPELGARAHAELALWRLQLDDRAGARADAQRAAALAPHLGIAQVARFLAEPPTTPSEWAVRAERILPAGTLKEYALACALLLNGEYKEALPRLRDIYKRWSPTGDPGIPVLLAWAFAETGNAREAAALLERNPLPQSTGLNPFTALYFPRIFLLRGNQELYQKLSR